MRNSPRSPRPEAPRDYSLPTSPRNPFFFVKIDRRLYGLGLRWASTAASRRWCCSSATAARARTTRRPPHLTAVPATARRERSMHVCSPDCSTSRKYRRAPRARHPGACGHGVHRRTPQHDDRRDRRLRPRPARGDRARPLGAAAAVLAQSGDQVRRTRALTLGLDTPRCSTSCAAGPTTVRRRDPNGASLATRHF